MSHDDSTMEGMPVVDPDATVVHAPETQTFTRGQNPRSAVAWVEKNHGEEGVLLLRRLAPRDLQVDLGKDLRPPKTSWVPFMSHAKLIELIAHTFGEGAPEATARSVGRYMAERDLPGITKPLGSLVSPGLLVDVSTKIWRLFNSHGHWELLRGKRELTAALFDRPEAHPMFCVAVLGWIEGALISCGAVEAHAIEERCICKGEPCCSIKVTWREAKDGFSLRLPKPPS